MIYPSDSLIQCINHFTLDRYFQNLLSNPVDSGSPNSFIGSSSFGMSRNDPSKGTGERCVTFRKTAAKETICPIVIL